MWISFLFYPVVCFVTASNHFFFIFAYVKIIRLSRYDACLCYGAVIELNALLGLELVERRDGSQV